MSPALYPSPQQDQHDEPARRTSERGGWQTTVEWWCCAGQRATRWAGRGIGVDGRGCRRRIDRFDGIAGQTDEPWALARAWSLGVVPRHEHLLGGDYRRPP